MNGHNICHWCIIAISVQIFDFPAAQPIPNGNNKEPPPVAPKPSREKRSSVDGLLDMLEGTVPDTPNENYRRYVCHTTPPPFKTTLYNPVLHHYKITNSCIRNTYHRARPLCVFMLLYEPPSTITVYYNHIPPSVTSYNNHPLIMYR